MTGSEAPAGHGHPADAISGPYTGVTPRESRSTAFLWGPLIAYVLLRLGLPALRIPSSPGLDVFWSTALATLALWSAVGLGTSLRTRLRQVLVLAASVPVFILIVRVVAPAADGHWAVAVASDLCQLVAAAAGGALLSSLVRESKVVPVLVVTVGLVDVVGVWFGGPVAILIESKPDVVAAFSQKIPRPGSAVQPAGPGEAPRVSYLATAGLGDLVFVAFFFACVARFGLSYAPTLATTLVLGAAAMWLATARDLPVPALPFLAVGTLICNARHFRYTRAERFALLYGAVFLIGMCFLIVWGTQWL
ncbi:MAG TPA: hypothetical protein PLD23_19580, partial [Armatimonadota bacterium]|nr:hypothetical protein [Armatimonadota bacterium]